MAIDCTTLARVQARVPNTDSAGNSMISALISKVSQVFERSLYRHIEQVERTEVYPLRPPARVISLKGAPCVVTDGRGVSLNTFSVKVSASTDFSASTALARNTNYIVEEDRGVLRIIDRLETFTGALGRSVSPAYVQVVYTGGLAADTDAVIADHPALAGACDDQVVYEYLRRTEPGASDVRMGDSNATHSNDVALLDGVVRILNDYKRRGG